METLKKYISHSGVIIELGDFYGGNDEVVVTLEDDSINLRLITNKDIYILPLQVGDYLSLPDGSGKLIKNKHNGNE